MKRQWLCLQLRFNAPKDFNLAIASRWAALSGNALLIATFSSKISQPAELKMANQPRRQAKYSSNINIFKLWDNTTNA